MQRWTQKQLRERMFGRLVNRSPMIHCRDTFRVLLTASTFNYTANDNIHTGSIEAIDQLDYHTKHRHPLVGIHKT